MEKQQEAELMRAFRKLTDPEDRRYVLAITQKRAESQITSKVNLKLVVGGLAPCATVELLRKF